MGLSVAIAGGITIFTIIVIFSTIFIASEKIHEEGLAGTLIFENDDEISKTKLEIYGLNATVGSNLVNFTLKNVGIEKLWKYDEFDFFITYDADIGGIPTRINEKLNYNEAAFVASPATSIETSEFYIQRDCLTIPNGVLTTTLTAGVDYDAPTGEAFVRLTNTRLTGGGHTDDSNDDQSVQEFTVMISDASDLTNQIVFERVFGPAAVDTGFCIEIIEFRGFFDSPNAIKVLDRNEVTYPTSSLTVSGPSVIPTDLSGSDVVVFITGQMGHDTVSSDWNNALSIAEWDSVNNEPDFKRGQADGSLDQNLISYAVVEFTGSNWKIQRYEHTVTVDGVQVDIDFDSVGLEELSDISNAFLHTQHSATDDTPDELGAEVWISADDTLSIFAEGSGSSTRVIGIWIIENRQGQGVRLNSQHFSHEYVNTNDILRVLNAPADFVAVDSMKTASIFGENARSTGGVTRYPTGSIGITLFDVDDIRLLRSDNNGGGGEQGQDQRIRFSLVEYPRPEKCVGGDSGLIAINEWTFSCITYDHFDPGIINTGESSEILGKIEYPIFANGLLEIILVTDNGKALNKTMTVT